MQETYRKSVTLVLGGVRSGKSRFAQQLAMRAQSVAFIATAQYTDAEMEAKIARHQQERPAAWRTVEEPLELHGVLQENSERYDLLLIDCLTFFASNLLEAESKESNLERRIEAFCQALTAAKSSIVLVSNEVGSGVVPEYASGRRYRDLLGEINQRVAALADNVLLMVAGLPLVLKGRLEVGA
jgi:adenosylcobinamide kinase / adenosylcobinamide-phosphate guanylyltransferase